MIIKGKNIPTDWLVIELSKIATVTMGQSPESASYNSEGNGIFLIQGNADIFNRKSAPRIFTTEPKKFCTKGDILLSVRAPVGSIAKAIHDACIGRGICAVRPSKINPEYLYQYLFSKEKGWEKYEQGSTFTSINKDDILSLPVLVPPSSEQDKISTLLSKVDTIIDLNEQLLGKIENMRKYLSLETIRFGKNDSIPKSLTFLNIGDVVTRIKNSVAVRSEEVYKEIGIRSHAKGIFHKEAVKGESLGNKSVFWVEPDCFVVNIVFAWEQAVAKTTEAEVGMIASHRFPMYKPKEGVLDLDYLLYFFKSAKGKNLLELASPGGAGRNKTLGQSEFLKLKIPVPPIEEQKKIVRLLNAADKEIELQKQKIEAIKLQKKGLMQQLLNGKKRLIS